jgi:hypothetical protein
VETLRYLVQLVNRRCTSFTIKHGNGPDQGCTDGEQLALRRGQLGARGRHIRTSDGRASSSNSGLARIPRRSQLRSPRCLTNLLQLLVRQAERQPMLSARRRTPSKAGRRPRTRAKIEFHGGILHPTTRSSYVDPRKVDPDTAASTAR